MSTLFSVVDAGGFVPPLLLEDVVPPEEEDDVPPEDDVEPDDDELPDEEDDVPLFPSPFSTVVEQATAKTSEARPKAMPML